MKSPRTLDDLKFASELTAFPGSGPGNDSLEIDGDYDRVLFSGAVFADTDAGGARFTECAFTGGAGFDGGRLRRSRLSDVWFGETRLVAVDMAESSLTDVWFSGCVFAGVQAFSCVGRRVLLRGCKLDSVNFRDARLTDVVFEDCVLRDVDFGSAKLAPGTVSRMPVRPAWTSPARPACPWTCVERGSGLPIRRGSRRATTA